MLAKPIPGDRRPARPFPASSSAGSCSPSSASAISAYIERVSEAQAGDLRDLAASLGPDAEEAYVTTAEMLRAEGEARGVARAKAEGILMVFEQRGFDVDDKSRELIESCMDLGVLNGWFRRAFKVDKVSDLFDE
jgi:hypothetical protein